MLTTLVCISTNSELLRSVGVNLNNVFADVYIGALASTESGMLFNKFGIDTSINSLVDINVTKMGKLVYTDKAAIRSFYHHGLFKITGDFNDHITGIAANQSIIEITDDGAEDDNDYYLISNARFDSGTESGSSAIKINNSTNKVRVTDCIFEGTTPFSGSSSPSYVRGCIGPADTP